MRPNDRRASPSPQAGTIRNELAMLKTICRWGMGFRLGGRPLLGHDPMHGIQLPREENVARPVASVDRYRKLLGVADSVEPRGRLRLLLLLAWETGRRINVILHLRRTDLLLTPEEVRRALAEEGQDERLADAWPVAIR